VEPLKITHNYVLVEFVALAHARGYPRHIALSFVADLATHNIDLVWVIIRFSQNLHNWLRVSDYAGKMLVGSVTLHGTCARYRTDLHTGHQ